MDSSEEYSHSSGQLPLTHGHAHSPGTNEEPAAHPQAQSAGCEVGEGVSGEGGGARSEIESTGVPADSDMALVSSMLSRLSTTDHNTPGDGGTTSLPETERDR